MKFTDTLQIPYLSPEDYGNVPLYLQRLAETVEAQAGAVDDAVLEASNRPFAVWRYVPTIPLTIAAAPAFGSIFELSNSALVDANYDVFADDIRPGRSPWEGMTGAEAAGVWHLTWNVSVSPVGAITAKSFRSAIVQVVRLAGDHYDVILDCSTRNAVETDTALGSTRMTGEALMLIGEDAASTYISATISHTNAASNLQVTEAQFALRKCGTDDVIEVS